MSARLKMKCTRLAVGYAKDDYWLALELPATILDKSSAQIAAILKVLYFSLVYCHLQNCRPIMSCGRLQL